MNINRLLLILALIVFIAGCQGAPTQMPISAITSSPTNPIRTMTPPTPMPASPTSTTKMSVILPTATATIEGDTFLPTPPSTLPQPPTGGEFIQMECMESEELNLTISMDDPKPTKGFFVEDRWVVVPIPICRSLSSEGFWIISVEVNSIISKNGTPLEPSQVYFRSRPFAGYNGTARYETGVGYTLSPLKRAKEHDFILEFEDTNEFDSAPDKIQLFIKVDLFPI
jgi:hypothetical protein